MNIVKKATSILVALVLSFGMVLVTPAQAACAQALTPVLNAQINANDQTDSPDAGWVKTLNTQGGHRVQFDIEIHNTVVGSTATNVTAKVGMPTGSGTSLSIPLTVTANNAAGVSDSDTINIPAPGGQITYVANSSRFTWDKDGDGIPEYSNAAIVDGLTSGSGIPLGDQNGCNNFIMKIEFLADVTGGTAPTPTPTPTPAPAATTSTPTQTQSQSQSQTVNVTQTTQAPAPKPVVTKSPATGPELTAILGMFGAGPIGVVMSRYGRGMSAFGKREEDLMGLATGLFLERKTKKIS